MSFVL